MVQVQVDMIATRANATAFTNFHRHTAGHIVARGQIFVIWGITLHETLAFRVGQITTLAARALGNQATSAVNAGWVKLHKFHILQWQPLTGDHTAAITCTGVGRCGAEIRATVTTSGQNSRLGVEHMHRAVVQLPCNNTLTLTIFRHDQISGEILDVEFSLLLQALAIKRMQNRVTSPVSSSTSPLHRRAFTKFGCVAPKRALINLAFFGA